MNLISYIVWDPAKEMFRLPFNDHPIVWYGLLFAMGFIVGQQLMFYIFKAENKPKQDVETLTLYMVIATVVGARLGHCLFYDPIGYLSDPISILYVWEGGLASHGAAVGILTGIYLYSKKKPGQSYLWVVDRIVIIVALAGCFIRFGNFVNSEIVGMPTDKSWGVVFARSLEERVQIEPFIERAEASKPRTNLDSLEIKAPLVLTIDFAAGVGQSEAESYLQQGLFHSISELSRRPEPHILAPDSNPLPYKMVPSSGSGLRAQVVVSGNPRHAAQLYESISCFILFLVLLYIWSVRKEKTPEGLIFGIFLVVLFGLRFFYEFIKENQEAFEDDIPLNMGQWLSIPLVIAGVIILYRVLKKHQGTGS